MPKRIYRALLLAWLALGALASSSAAQTTIVEPEGSHFPYQRWVDQAEVPTPDATITVVETSAKEGCPGSATYAVACTAPTEQTIWLAPDVLIGWQPRLTFLHEIGHNVDADLLTSWMRSRFLAILKLLGAWGDESSQPYPPDERFADVYAECAIHPFVPPHHLGFEPIGGPVRHDRLCRMLARL